MTKGDHERDLSSSQRIEEKLDKALEQVRFLKDEQKTQIAYTEPEENHSTHNTPQLNVSFEKNKKMLAKSKTMLPNSPKSLGNSSLAQSRNTKLNN